jgi:hypothetical protein
MSKIIVFDIETAPIVANTWSLYPKYLSHDNIISDWFIICAAWKEVGKDKVHTAKITTVGNDYEVVKTLRDALAGADAIVGHNIDKFDLKKLNTRLIVHGLEPLPKVPTIDTLKEVRKVAAFSSNRLDYLSKTLLGEGKIEVGYGLWLSVMKGSKKAINDMVAYNKVDVIRNEAVYLKLRPYMKNHPHKGVMDGEARGCSCQACGSTKIKKNGIRVSAAGVKSQEIQCKTCNHYSRVPLTLSVVGS